MEIVHYHANGHFDRLLSGHQSVNPSREEISILSGKSETFMFVHPMLCCSTVRRIGPGLIWRRSNWVKESEYGLDHETIEQNESTCFMGRMSQ